jgi:hypothetical protein
MWNMDPLPRKLDELYSPFSEAFSSHQQA